MTVAYNRPLPRYALARFVDGQGWPHRFGYDPAIIRRLVQKHGFAFVRTLRRAAVRPFREVMHTWAREEEARVIRDADHGWMEVTFRK